MQHFSSTMYHPVSDQVWLWWLWSGQQWTSTKQFRPKENRFCTKWQLSTRSNTRIIIKWTTKRRSRTEVNHCNDGGWGGGGMQRWRDGSGVCNDGGWGGGGGYVELRSYYNYVEPLWVLHCILWHVRLINFLHAGVWSADRRSEDVAAKSLCKCLTKVFCSTVLCSDSPFRHAHARWALHLTSRPSLIPGWGECKTKLKSYIHREMSKQLCSVLPRVLCGPPCQWAVTTSFFFTSVFLSNGIHSSIQ